MRSRRILAGILLSVLSITTGTGCSVDVWYHGDLPWPFWMPVPVPQFIGDHIQEKKEKDYSEVPIMPPVRDYAPVFCMDPPSEYDVLRVMKKPSGQVIGNIPFLYEKHYNDMEIVVEKIVDHIDDCRFYPLVGPAQLHHCHYKCTIYFQNIRYSYWPFSWFVDEKDVEVVYIDKDHLHICTSPEMEAIPESYQDIYGPY
ncbi:hypothetical protein Pan216_07090 [Planctomycetes bacterium Pan216]|uniref:Lipoprotein n=1 Tax=Kolteria novifilia TaxID=2527975 RepID=A0A518AYS5_9BACT|nr:hypothetical protein Pan216_07090 [Planctomycetes bacterium Pan216]